MEYYEFKVDLFVRALTKEEYMMIKWIQKYGKIFKITKVKNNSVIIKNDKDYLYRASKNEIKVVVKPDKDIKMTGKKNA